MLASEPSHAVMATEDDNRLKLTPIQVKVANGSLVYNNLQQATAAYSILQQSAAIHRGLQSTAVYAAFALLHSLLFSFRSFTFNQSDERRHRAKAPNGAEPDAAKSSMTLYYA